MRKHLWGLFSGGYVTVLAAIFVVMLRMTFIEAMATTKLINVFLSGIATLRGAVNYRLGTIRCSPRRSLCASDRGSLGSSHFPRCCLAPRAEDSVRRDRLRHSLAPTRVWKELTGDRSGNTRADDTSAIRGQP
jgi:hypothetical protein